MVKGKRENMDGASSCLTKINEAVDIVSSLPDNVFTVIFSFLTMKEALYTCVSCRKLKHLMTLIPNVEFKETGNVCLAKKREFVESVSRFLNNHDGLVRKFQLSFCPLGYRSDVCYWLSLVVKNGIEELDLVFNDRNNLMIPPSLLTAATIKVLKLRHCIVDIPFISGFKSLKTLLLGSMYITDSVMALICCHCESLQHLTLENCSGFTEIEIVHPGSKLETLILSNCCRDLVALKLLCLKTLFIGQGKMNFFFVGLPHIDDLILYREAELPITQEESQNMKDNIINSLGNVRCLQLAGWAFECFTAYRSNYQLTKLEEILLLDFNVCLKNMNGLTNLIRQADGVNKLLIEINENSSRTHRIYTDRNFERVLKNFLDNEYDVQRTVALSNSAVHSIHIQGFTGTIYELSHIRLMLAQFPRLRLLKVTPIKEIDEDQSRAYAKLISSFPRRSAVVCMLVGCENFDLKNE